MVQKDNVESKKCNFFSNLGSISEKFLNNYKKILNPASNLLETLTKISSEDVMSTFLEIMRNDYSDKDVDLLNKKYSLFTKDLNDNLIQEVLTFLKDSDLSCKNFSTIFQGKIFHYDIFHLLEKFNYFSSGDLLDFFKRAKDTGNLDYFYVFLKYQSTDYLSLIGLKTNDDKYKNLTKDVDTLCKIVINDYIEKIQKGMADEIKQILIEVRSIHLVYNIYKLKLGLEKSSKITVDLLNCVKTLYDKFEAKPSTCQFDQKKFNLLFDSICLLSTDEKIVTIDLLLPISDKKKLESIYNFLSHSRIKDLMPNFKQNLEELLNLNNTEIDKKFDEMTTSLREKSNQEHLRVTLESNPEKWIRLKRKIDETESGEIKKNYHYKS